MNEEQAGMQYDDATDGMAGQDIAEPEQEAADVSADISDDVDVADAEEFILNTPDGGEIVLRPEEIVDLTQKVREYENRVKQLEQLEQYTPLLNYITNDELINRVILYRLQGNKPADIVKYLYNFFEERGMLDERPEYEQQGVPNQEIDSLKQELNSLREYMTVQSLVQQNAAQLMRTAEQLGVEIDDNQDYSKILGDISQDLYGDRTYVVRVPLNQRQARVIVQELKERLGAQKQGSQPSVRAKVAARPAEGRPRQFPAGVKTGGDGARTSVQGAWSPAKAQEAYLKLLGG
jgi:hypothetical protein